MKHNCIIVDDEQVARDILKKYVAQSAMLDLKMECRNAIEAIEYLEQEEVDIVFLDIEMPKLSGLNMAKLVREDLQIIFTTAHRKFAVEGFELNATDYLLKPFSFDRFLAAVKKAIENNTKRETPKENLLDHMYFKVDKKMVKVHFSDLLYIEGLGNYIKIHTETDAFVVYEKMNDLEITLQPHMFKRIHKSYIVNCNKIKAYTKETVELGEKQLPISNTYRQSFFGSFQQ